MYSSIEKDVFLNPEELLWEPLITFWCFWYNKQRAQPQLPVVYINNVN